MDDSVNVSEFVLALQRMPSDAEVVTRIADLGDELVRAVPRLYEGTNAPAAEWPLRPFVEITGWADDDW